MTRYNETEEATGPWGGATDADRIALSRALLDVLPDGAFFADRSLMIRYANHAFARMALFGQRHSGPSHGADVPLDELYPLDENRKPLANARAALSAVGFWSGELARTDADGRLRLDELTVTAARGASGFFPDAPDTAPRYVGVARDVTARKEAEERLAWTRNHDELTGLPNRALFAATLDAVIARSGSTGAPVAVVVADLDDFKRYNTDYGHDLGDRLLKAAAERLCSRARPGDIVARTAGDEFTVLMVVRAADHAETAAAVIRDAFDDPLSLGGQEYPLRASLGVAVWPDDGKDAATLMAAADLALQECKSHGKDGIMCFDEGLFSSRRGKTQLETELRDAIDGELLSVHYQPVVRVADGTVESVEALVRWRHPSRGELGPDSFIPLAEETGLIVSLGALVLRSACAQGDRWNRGGTPSLRVAVNVSPIQLEHPGFPGMMAEALARSGLAPGRLVVEITESVLLERLDDAAYALGALKALGVGISVDDFGTGYSSFSYLKNLPVDTLKIDKEFVRGMEDSETAREIVGGIVGLAHRMNLTVVAEGVETAEQYYLLRSMDCDFAQGYLFGRPVPAHELEGRYFARGGASRFSAFLLRR